MSYSRVQKTSLDADTDQSGPECASMLENMREEFSMPTQAYSSLGYQQMNFSLENDWSASQLTYDANPTLGGAVVGASDKGPMKEYDFSDADCDW